LHCNLDYPRRRGPELLVNLFEILWHPSKVVMRTDDSRPIQPRGRIIHPGFGEVELDVYQLTATRLLLIPELDPLTLRQLSLTALFSSTKSQNGGMRTLTQQLTNTRR